MTLLQLVLAIMIAALLQSCKSSIHKRWLAQRLFLALHKSNARHMVYDTGEVKDLMFS